MSLRFDNAFDGASLIFDYQDRVGYLQTDSTIITLSDNGTHEHVDIIEHGLFAYHEIYAAGTHEHLPEPQPFSYNHTTPVSITLISVGTHEYVDKFVVWDQEKPGAGEDYKVILSDNGYHVHWPGGDDYIQTGDDSYTLSDNGTHSFLASTYVAVSEHVTDYIERWLGAVPTDVVVDFSSLASSVGRVTFTLECANELYTANSGPDGGSVSAAIEVVTETEVLSIVSLSNNYPRATVFDYGAQSENFLKMSAAMAAGPVTLRVGGYEGLVDRSLPLRLSGEATLRVEALVSQ